MSERKTLQNRELVEEIARLCNQQASGTIFIVTPGNQLAKMVLIEGEIVCASFHRLDGLQAVKNLARLPSGQFGFNPDLQLVTRKDYLPDTETLIRILQSGGTVESAPGNLEFSSSDGGQTGNAEIMRILIDEAIEFIGPMATVLCQDYMSNLPHFPNTSQINQVILQLEVDINDEEKAKQFRAAVVARLDEARS